MSVQSEPHPSPPGAQASACRVLLVEDERSISEPFSHALAREGYTPVLACTAAEARAAIAAERPDIVLLDLMLPDADGRDLARELRAASDVPIVMLTARGSHTDKIVGLELGADDYIVKPFAAAEVIARIRAVLRRTGSGRTGMGRSPSRLSAGGVTVDLAARRVWRGEQELALTRKELDLLARLLRDPGAVVTREDLMSDVWDVNWFGATKTLDVHIAALRRKLGGENEGEGASPIETVRGVGYRFAA